MKPLCSYKDKYGSYSLSLDEQIIIGCVSGALGDSLSKHFFNDMCSVIKKIRPLNWAYLADMRECDGLTETAEKNLQQAYRYSINNGCVVDAYCVQSPVAIDQMRRIRQELGIKGEMNDHVFAELQDASVFIANVMSNIK
jgi:hypothetical protein